MNAAMSGPGDGGMKTLRKISVVPMITATYFMVAGGPYGLEDIVQKTGYTATLLILVITPLLWSLPTALMVSELATATSEARTCQRACERAAQALATNPRDLPFAMIYIAEPGSRMASLVSATGIARDHPAAAATLSLDSSDPWPIGEVLQSRAPRVVAGLTRPHTREIDAPSIHRQSRWIF